MSGEGRAPGPVPGVMAIPPRPGTALSSGQRRAGVADVVVELTGNAGEPYAPDPISQGRLP